MSSMTATEIIERYEQIFPAIVKDRWRTDSCLAATRLTINILGAFGIACGPLPVQVLAYNPEWVKRAQKSGGPPSVEDMPDWIDKGGWSVGIGFGDEQEGKWAGHMVALTASPLLEQQVIIDLSLGQASRPEKQMELPPTFVLPVTDGFMQKQEPLMRLNHQGSLVTYARHPAPPPWEDAPDWQMHRHGLIEIAVMRALMKSGVPFEKARVLNSIREAGAQRRGKKA